MLVFPCPTALRLVATRADDVKSLICLWPSNLLLSVAAKSLYFDRRSLYEIRQILSLFVAFPVNQLFTPLTGFRLGFPAITSVFF